MMCWYILWKIMRTLLDKINTLKSIMEIENFQRKLFGKIHLYHFFDLIESADIDNVVLTDRDPVMTSSG